MAQSARSGVDLGSRLSSPVTSLGYEEPIILAGSSTSTGWRPELGGWVLGTHRGSRRSERFLSQEETVVSRICLLTAEPDVAVMCTR